jgi:hypothetical protein
MPDSDTASWQHDNNVHTVFLGTSRYRRYQGHVSSHYCAKGQKVFPLSGDAMNLSDVGWNKLFDFIIHHVVFLWGSKRQSMY